MMYDRKRANKKERGRKKRRIGWLEKGDMERGKEEGRERTFTVDPLLMRVLIMDIPNLHTSFHIYLIEYFPLHQSFMLVNSPQKCKEMWEL